MKNGHLTVLHTSDWHIGHVLSERKRDDEFEFFFNWLAQTIKNERVDCLLVAGDIFDTSTPSTNSQGLYLDFLVKARDQGCRHLVIASGNHDPAMLLEVHKPILERMDIHVIGVPDVENPENEVLVLKNGAGEPELVVCAVPFLREKYVRRSAPGESPEEKETKLLEGIAAHYKLVAQKALEAAGKLSVRVPVIGMGHLFAGGGKIREGDNERQLYVGTLGQINVDIFSPHFDYVALGHLHVPQAVGKIEHIRYSGSPIPMGFSEAGHEKSVCLLEFAGGKPEIKLLAVPEFRYLERIEGDLPAIEKRMRELALKDKTNGIWLEIICADDEFHGNLRERLENLAGSLGLDILGIKNNRLRETVLGMVNLEEELDELDERTVFERCLAANNVPEDRRPDLARVFDEVLAALNDEPGIN